MQFKVDSENSVSKEYISEKARKRFMKHACFSSSGYRSLGEYIDSCKLGCPGLNTTGEVGGASPPPTHTWRMTPSIPFVLNFGDDGGRYNLHKTDIKGYIDTQSYLGIEDGYVHEIVGIVDRDDNCYIYLHSYPLELLATVFLRECSDSVYHLMDVYYRQSIVTVVGTDSRVFSYYNGIIKVSGGNQQHFSDGKSLSPTFIFYGTDYRHNAEDYKKWSAKVLGNIFSEETITQDISPNCNVDLNCEKTHMPFREREHTIRDVSFKEYIEPFMTPRVMREVKEYSRTAFGNEDTLLTLSLEDLFMIFGMVYFMPTSQPTYFSDITQYVTKKSSVTRSVVEHDAFDGTVVEMKTTDGDVCFYYTSNGEEICEAIQSGDEPVSNHICNASFYLAQKKYYDLLTNVCYNKDYLKKFLKRSLTHG